MCENIKIGYIKIEFTVVCRIRPVKCQRYTSQVSKKGLQKLKKLLHLEMPVVSTFEKFNKKKVDVVKSVVFNGKM